MSTHILLAVLVSCASAVGGCRDAVDSTRVPPVTSTPTALDSAAGRALRAADEQFVQRFPVEAPRVVAAGVPAPGQALIGRNRDWGDLYAARFQMGTGSALRTTLVLDARAEAARAFAGVEIGFRDMAPSGRLQARVPAPIAMGQTMRDADVASGAAFFLGDACAGLLSLAVAPQGPTLVPSARQSQVHALAARSAAWLALQAQLL